MSDSNRTLIIESLSPAQCSLPHPVDVPQADCFTQRSKRQVAIAAEDSQKFIGSCVDELPRAVAIIAGGDGDYLRFATAARKLSESSTTVQRVGDLLPHLVQWLQRADFPSLQYEASWAVLNCTWNSSALSQELLDLQVIPALVLLLDSAVDDIIDHAISALTNLASWSPSSRDTVLQSGALPFLAECGCTRPSHLDDCVLAITNLCRGEPNYTLATCAVPAVVLAISRSERDAVVSGCVWTLADFSGRSSIARTAIIESGVGALLASLVTKSEATAAPARRVIGNFAAGSVAEKQFVLDAGALPGLLECVQSSSYLFREEAMKAIRNIAAGSRPQMDVLVSAGVFPLVFTALADEYHTDLRKEAVHFLINALHHDFTDYILQTEAVEALCKALCDSQKKVLVLAMKALGMLVEHGGEVKPRVLQCGGVDRLEDLQCHSSRKVRQKATNLLDQCFQVEG